ncbi:MAG: P-II family nitrogen regulator [Pseudomonadota bacterium]
MQTHLKKRVEIFIEAPLLRRVVARFDSLRVSGYSVLPVLAGNGHEGRWEANGLVGDAGKMMAVICILDPADLPLLLDGIYPIVQRQIGILAISDVEVVRNAHF